MRLLIALVAGAIFGIGLTISQMVDPNRVLGFLDLFGQWDASLIFVMAAAFSVFTLGYHLLIKNREKSITGDPIGLSNITVVNKQLVLGAATFGIGWGMSGICPGPALANITGGDTKIYVFVVLMVIGMKTSEFFKVRYL